MRVLILGAGGIGGYFGGRAAATGVDVSFLVRPTRAALLQRAGLRIRSPLGDLHLNPAILTSETLSAELNTPFDLVVLSCKAYDLGDAIATIAPAVSPGTAVLPLLNGLAHFPVLDQAFGAGRVLGGLAHISVVLAADGAIDHLSPAQVLRFGERDGTLSERCRRIDDLLRPAGLDLHLSTRIRQDLWDKFVFLTTLASMTCLMRGSVGEISRAEEGGELFTELLGECLAVARAAGHEPAPETQAMLGRVFADGDSALTASMLRDLESGGRIESRAITGDMLSRARAAGVPAPLLRAAYAHLQTYENRRAGRAVTAT